MNDTELSRLLHGLALSEPDPDLLPRVHRRLARRRTLRYTTLTAATLLLCGGLTGVLLASSRSVTRVIAGGAASPGSASASPTSASPPPPTCSAAVLTASTQVYGYPSGTLHYVTELRLTNTGPAPCRLAGWPVVQISRNGVNVTGPVTDVGPAALTNPDHPSSTATQPRTLTLLPGGDVLVLIDVGDYYSSPAACPGLGSNDSTVRLQLPKGGGTLVVSGMDVAQCRGNVVLVSPFVQDHHGFPAGTYSTPPQTEAP